MFHFSLHILVSHRITFVVSNPLIFITIYYFCTSIIIVFYCSCCFFFKIVLSCDLYSIWYDFSSLLLWTVFPWVENLSETTSLSSIKIKFVYTPLFPNSIYIIIVNIVVFIIQTLILIVFPYLTQILYNKKYSFLAIFTLLFLIYNFLTKKIWLYILGYLD